MQSCTVRYVLRSGGVMCVCVLGGGACNINILDLSNSVISFASLKMDKDV